MKLRCIAGLGILLCGLGVSHEASAQTTLTPDQMRTLAAEVLATGDAGQAEFLAGALLSRDPADVTALLVRSQAAFMSGAFGEARTAAAQAYRLAPQNDMRYAAARLTALAAANEGRLTLAGWWLRRALTVAPTPEDTAQTIADARDLRRVNPWSSSVELAFAPSDNVNGGANSRFNIIDGVPLVGVLSADAQALSGWTGVLDLDVSYRIAASQRAQTTLSARLYVRGVVLSEEATAFLAAAESSADAGDFSTALLQFGVRHDRALSNGSFGVSLDLGQAWSGGDFDHTFLRLGASRRLPLSDVAGLTFAGSLEQRWDDADDPNEWRYALQGSWSRVVAGRDRLTLTLATSEVLAERVNDSATARTLQASYALGQPLGPAQVQVSVGVQSQDFDAYRIGFIAVPGGRQDLRVFGAVDLFFPTYSYAGFAPVVTLSGGRTDSNISRFDRDDLSVSFAFRSTF